jgi:hypothetical protein
VEKDSQSSDKGVVRFLPGSANAGELFLGGLQRLRLLVSPGLLALSLRANAGPGFKIQAVASGGKDGKMSTTSSTVH